MTDSLIPADHEIRVLLTIKNGQVTERRLHADEILATPERFVDVIRRIGYQRDLIGPEVRQALELSNQLREALLFWAERARSKKDVDRGFNFVNQLNEIIALQKKVIGE